MPFTVITLKKVPQALRGDLTKWMQEITTGVYIGNFNTKVREKLWKRVKENVKDGEATLSFSYRNELGYQFDTNNTSFSNIDMDGIPLVFIPNENVDEKREIKHGFSNAAKFRNAKKYMTHKSKLDSKDFVVIDIETDGLDKEKDVIIEIGAVKSEGGIISEFQSLISYEGTLPKHIVAMTGITTNMLKTNGKSVDVVLKNFKEFIGDLDIIGYNVSFDIEFINIALSKFELEKLENKRYDLMKFVKNEKLFLANYKLQTVIKEYGVGDEVPHRALEDARLIYKLAVKVNKFRDLYSLT
ncbi:CRISPR-associated endoribonuclease Cas2, subtype TIGR01873 [Lachnoanaerobaculum sp. MSX33]|uniref:type I-E CRISPR-associated endoribonuclease Cas2e n=1 Tax=Lachnoanaerobaculum sp. MSX33 TaxID=936596 RepID=UPI0003DFA5BD|nr:type I-E CRISPR-associated endoribonuclease Cas2e [Lachnoanaerobaculum sp. MSX33]ETO96099.1 CRISPR-associated endoribonuclease Cas2, subtype TIGR01873 [Lachnoanaerobaculum sp. MSX33]